MTADEGELERLRRRAYGPAADIAGDPAALARLQELERASGDAPRFAPGDAPHEAEDAPVTGPAPESDPLSPARPAEAPSLAERDAARPAAPTPRWITRGGAIGSAVALVAVLLIAGGFGWGGGFLSGWGQGARAADLPPEAELMTVLEPTEMSARDRERMREDALVMPVDPVEEGDIAEPVYFGSIGADVHLLVPDGGWAPNAHADQVCLQIVTFIDTGEETRSASWTGTCGSRRLGITFDFYATDPDSGQAFGGAAVHGIEPGGVIRLVYDDPSQTISVWTLPPAEEEPETDPTP